MKKFTYSLIFAFIAILFLGSNAFGQITLVGSQTNTSTSTSFTITKPVGLAIGDIMIANILQGDNDDTNGDFANAGVTTGVTAWTVISGANLESNTNQDNGWRQTVLYKIATQADVDATSYTVTLPASGNDRNLGAISAFRGVDVTTPFDVANGNISVATTNIAASGKTTVTANTALVLLGAVTAERTLSTWSTTNPGAFPALNELYDFSGAATSGTTLGLSIAASWVAKPAIGATGTGVAEISGADVRNGGLLIALRAIPVPVVLPNPIGCNGQYYISHTANPTGPTANTLVDKLTFAGLSLTPVAFGVDDGQPGTIGFNAMGLNPIDGYMYAVRYPDGAAPHLILIGTGPGVNQIDLGAINGVGNVDILAGCFDKDGNFYFTTSGDEFYIITAANLASRTATEIGSGNAAYSDFADLAVNPVDGQMYGTTNATGTSNYLFPINKGTGAIGTGQNSSVSMPNFFAGLFFDETGNLFGYRGDGLFFLINKATGELSNQSNGTPYSGADGCSCSFGRVFHDLDAPGVCPGLGGINNPTFNITVTVTNQSSAVQSGLGYELILGTPTPSNRFSFNETPAAIAQKLFDAGLLPTNAAGQVVITSAAPGTNNKLNVSNFRTGAVNSIVNFTLQLKVVTLGGAYAPVAIQSTITGLSSLLGSEDLSNDPQTTETPDDATVITFCPNISLPVSLLGFNGSLKNNATLLNWVAENQINFAYYNIERSSNGVDFAPIGTRMQQGNNTSRVSYQFTDDLSLVSGNVFYYRLKMVDIDGTFKYSNVIVVRKDAKGLVGLIVNPNPVNDNTATVRFEAATQGRVNFTVVDMAGRVVLTQQNTVTEGTNSVALDKLERLQPGVYMLQMNDGTTVQTAKFVISK